MPGPPEPVDRIDHAAPGVPPPVGRFPPRGPCVARLEGLVVGLDALAAPDVADGEVPTAIALLAALERRARELRRRLGPRYPLLARP